jgi:hypothetical protein
LHTKYNLNFGLSFDKCLVEYTPPSTEELTACKHKHLIAGDRMTQKKNYKFGHYRCYSYYKEVGHGYEVGFYFGTHKAFVGNFIHKTEAGEYWQHLNTEFKAFAKKYWAGPETSFAWYSKFFTNYIYKHYYNYLDTRFATYKRTYTSQVKKYEMDYKRKSKTWDKEDRYFVVNKAA